MWVRAFVSTFHTLKYSIWAKSDENLLQNALPTYFSTFQNHRLGSINFTDGWSYSKNTRFATACNQRGRVAHACVRRPVPGRRALVESGMKK